MRTEIKEWVSEKRFNMARISLQNFINTKSITYIYLLRDFLVIARDYVKSSSRKRKEDSIDAVHYSVEYLMKNRDVERRCFKEINNLKRARDAYEYRKLPVAKMVKAYDDVIRAITDNFQLDPVKEESLTNRKKSSRIKNPHVGSYFEDFYDEYIK